jgi:molybdate-binding protein
MFGTADVALGIRAVSVSFGLGFVPLAEVRSDLVIPEEIFNHPTVQVLLDVLQTRAFHRELASLEGYDAGITGKVIAQI